MFREATDWSVSLREIHVFMLLHIELLVPFCADLNPETEEQSRTRVRWRVISRSHRYLNFDPICCEFL